MSGISEGSTAYYSCTFRLLLRYAMHILGISALYHDSAACLIEDGRIIAAAQEERFSRKKHDPRWPGGAINYCLQEGGIQSRDLTHVVFHDKPRLKFERLMKTYMAYAPRGWSSFAEALPLWWGGKLWVEDMVQQSLDFRGSVLYAEHHQSHAMSAFYPSPFQDAAFLTLDGVGEWSTASYGVGRGNDVEILADLHFPHSLGLLYSAFTYYTGFKVNSGEYKVMGLAPYGTPLYRDLILEHVLDLRDDGSFSFDMQYFDFAVGSTMTSERFHDVFGGPPRTPESDLTQRDMDLAASVQSVVEEIVLKMARHVRGVTEMDYLCLAGGVALNCVANGVLLREEIFKDIWIQPAAGDAGGALGAALGVWHQYHGQPRKVSGRGDSMGGTYLGPEFSGQEVREFLAAGGYPYRAVNDEELPGEVADLLVSEAVVGWFQGRMEFGPRALGARSILGDARSPKMQSVMNLKIKYRESFRPFAPSVLEEHVAEWFDLDRPSPYMLLVAPVSPKRRVPVEGVDRERFGVEKLHVARSLVPAITHIDYSARVQSVSEDTNPRYYQLIRAFEERTGCPMVVNTSFNVRGEPLVCSPLDAYRCFMRTEMDYLVLGNYILSKNEQPDFAEDGDWRSEFELD